MYEYFYRVSEPEPELVEGRSRNQNWRKVGAGIDKSQLQLYDSTFLILLLLLLTMGLLPYCINLAL